MECAGTLLSTGTLPCSRLFEQAWCRSPLWSMQVQGVELAGLRAESAELEARMRCMEGEEAACRQAGCWGVALGGLLFAEPVCWCVGC